MPTPIWQWSAVDTAAAIKDGRVTSEAAVLAHVERMHAVNPALNAVVVDLSEQALEAARTADRAKASGARLGKLHGVPVTIKINIDVEGQANSNGVAGLRDNIAPGDPAGNGQPGKRLGKRSSSASPTRPSSRCAALPTIRCTVRP